MRVADRVDELTPAHFPDRLLTVAVFGPGNGEAQLLRFPDGSFGVVDGCRAHRAMVDPVAKLLSMFPSPEVRFVCLTHAHADHFGGLLDLIRAHEPKLLLWAGTENDRFRDQFVAAVRREQAGEAHPADAKELEELINLFAFRTQRRRHSRPGSRSIVLSDHKLIHRDSDGVRLWGVLPTTTSLHRALGCGLHPLLAKDVEPRAKAGDPNDVSGALLVEWGEARILLAGDALCGDSEHHEGWAAANWIRDPVQVVKVAHHASGGAHHAGLWDRMKPEIAIVTPFADAAGRRPPREEQLALLLGTTRTFLTAPPAWWERRRTLEGFDPPPLHPAGRELGTPLATAPGAVVRTPRPGSRNPASAVAVTLTGDGTVAAVSCAGEARELRVR